MKSVAPDMVKGTEKTPTFCDQQGEKRDETRRETNHSLMIIPSPYSLMQIGRVESMHFQLM